jgi:hypothetical protein
VCFELRVRTRNADCCRRLGCANYNDVHTYLNYGALFSHLFFGGIFRNACHAIPVPGKYFGLITFFFWYGELFASLSITINRFIAISFPLQYRQFFANRRCVIIFIILIWLLAAIEASPLIPGTSIM